MAHEFVLAFSLRNPAERVAICLSYRPAMAHEAAAMTTLRNPEDPNNTVMPKDAFSPWSSGYHVADPFSGQR